MIRIETSTQVSRPRNEVFEVLTDIESLAQWQTNIVQTRRISDGQMRVGFQFEQTAKIGPWLFGGVCTVTDIKVNERFGFVMKSNGPIDCDAHYDLQPVANGTRLTLNGTARLKGVWRLLQPMLGAGLGKETRAELARLKDLLESAAIADEPNVAFRA